MKDKSQISFKSIVYFFDVFFLIVYFFLFLKIQYNYISPINFSDESWELLEIFKMHYKALIILLFTWGFGANYVGGYNFLRRVKFVVILKKLITQIFIFTIIFFAVSGLKGQDLFSLRLAIYFLITYFSSILLVRVFSFLYFKSLHASGKNLSNIAIIGTNKNTFKLIEILKERKDYGFSVKGVLTNKINFDLKDIPVFLINQVSYIHFMEENSIQKIFISQMSFVSKSILNEISEYCDKNHIEIIYIPHSNYSEFTRLQVDYIDTLPLLIIKKFPLDLLVNKILKSVFDKVFALLVCVFILSWLFPIIALLVYLNSGGPVLFIQERNGLEGKKFGCYKFRTMIQCSTNSLVATERNDSRITKIGSFLRKTSLDELPQFFNVLKGEMSVVGPRPHMISQDVYYAEIIQKYSLRHYTKPGITGLAQVKGYRGAIDSDYDMEKRIRSDIFYVKNWSFLLDIQIIYQTVMLVVKGDDNAI